MSKMMRTFLLCVSLVVGLFVASQAYAQRANQYKRVHQRALKQIVDGQSDTAIADLNAFRERFPNDAESFYMLAVAYAREGQLDQSLAHVRLALEHGMPPGRFVGGSLTGLEALKATEGYQAFVRDMRYQLVHGPMLGQTIGDGISIWVRTVEEAEVQAVAMPAEGAGKTTRSQAVRTTLENDLSAVIQLKGLKPQTDYRYHVLVDGHRADQRDLTFRTFAVEGQPTKFRLAFGGGAGYVPQNERAWKTIQSKRPDILLLLGDNVYSDDPTTPEMQHYCYYRRQSRAEFRSLVASTPVYSIWDDHDFGTNDCSGGPEIELPAWKRPVFEVFRKNWVNPYYGGGDAQPGCYYDFYLGDVHFIMLDGRYYRNLQAADQGRPTMLGPVQRKWLLEKLEHSKGRLRVLCSPVPWVFEAKGDSRDTWNGFREERNEIFDHLARHKMTGVILVSADRHRSDLWEIKRPDAYTLYEFNSSRLTNQHVHKEMEQAVFSYNKKQSFGLIDFDTTADDPTIVYRILTIDGEEVFDFELKLSQLQ